MKETFKVTLLVTRKEDDDHPSRWEWSDLVGDGTTVVSIEKVEENPRTPSAPVERGVKKIRVVVAPVGEKPFETVIEDSLEAMQFLVGGPIEVIRVGDLDVWFNEEGLLMNLPYNRRVAGHDIVGTIFIATSNREGDTLGLSDVQTKHAIRMLSRTI